MPIFISAVPSRRSWLRQLHCIASHRMVGPSTNNQSLSQHQYQYQYHRTMSTGAARATTSRDVKQKLVNLLFRQKYNRTGPEGHKRLDFSIYSYDDLRREYLKRLQVIHPDKTNSHSDRNSDSDTRRQCQCQFGNQQRQKNEDTVYSKEESKKEFQELQNTWDRYEELTKSMNKVIQGDGATANFTQFGVGCSFSDNEEERALRNEITDQACRGWFTSGLVSSGVSVENNNQDEGDDEHDNVDNNNTKSGSSSQSSNKTSLNQRPLIDDTMFVPVGLCDTNGDSPGASNNRTTQTDNKSHRNRRRTLIPGIN